MCLFVGSCSMFSVVVGLSGGRVVGGKGGELANRALKWEVWGSATTTISTHIIQSQQIGTSIVSINT